MREKNEQFFKHIFKHNNHLSVCMSVIDWQWAAIEAVNVHLNRLGSKQMVGRHTQRHASRKH